jgi:hypothetical protein
MLPPLSDHQRRLNLESHHNIPGKHGTKTPCREMLRGFCKDKSAIIIVKVLSL